MSIVNRMAIQKLYSTLEFDKILHHLSSYAVTALAVERIEKLTPFNDIKKTQTELQRVTEIRDCIDYDAALPISSLKDIRIPLQKSQRGGSILAVDDILLVQETLHVIRSLKKFASSREEKYPLLQEQVQSLQYYHELEKEIDRCIDDEQRSIKDTASPELARIRRDIARTEQRARKKMDQMIQQFAQKGYLQEQVSSIRDGRLVLVVKEEHKSKVKGFIHDRSATGSSLFIEPVETFDLNNHLRELIIQAAAEEQRILQMLSARIGESSEDLLLDMENLGELDFTNAKAEFSRTLNAFQPALNNEHVIEIANGRHPLLLLRSENAKDVVPLNVSIGNTFTTLVITGPNAGGKTVALKTVGLLTLMTQCGMHIPADPHSTIGIFTNFFADIGDDQSIEQDLSTFTSHLANIREIATHADQHSLILIDEIGSGTDPDEGAALAMSILEQLTQRQSRSIVTTHQGILKAFAFQTDGVENGSMEFDVDTLEPTYRFRVNIPGSSYAFEIAQRLGLPKAIINRSRELVGAQKNKVEGLILELDSKLQHYTTLIKDVDAKNLQLDKLMSEYEEKTETFNREVRQLKKQAAQESEEILRNANATIENAVREIREQQASREVIRIAKENITEQRAQIDRISKEFKQPKVQPQRTSSDEPPKNGDEIIWTRYGTRGVITTSPDSSNKVLIEAGSIKTRVPLDELVKVTGSSKKILRSHVRYNIESTKTASDEIDLRGMQQDEALEVIEKFLDTAVLTGLKYIRIIHGKGTGALRKAVSKYLRSHPRIKNMRLGAWNEGGTGVTIVELR